jgi:hypothetical protein
MKKSPGRIYETPISPRYPRPTTPANTDRRGRPYTGYKRIQTDAFRIGGKIAVIVPDDQKYSQTQREIHVKTRTEYRRKRAAKGKPVVKSPVIFDRAGNG